jgi:hypothetical protein
VSPLVCGNLKGRYHLEDLYLDGRTNKMAVDKRIDVYWIQLTWNLNKLRYLVKTVINSPVPYNENKFFTS